MDLDLYRNSADQMFLTSDARIGFDSEVWALVEESGFDRLLLPEEHGGAGDAFAEAVTVAVSAGRYASAVPLVETLMANWSLSRAKLQVSRGVKSFVVCEPSIYERVEDGAIRLHKDLLVHWAPVADQIVFVLRGAEGECSLAIAESAQGANGTSLAGEPLTVVHAGTELRFIAVELFRDADFALGLAAILKSATMSGAVATVLDLSIEYANSRKQFGRTIGAFQAVQHMVVSIASEKAAMDAALEYAVKVLPKHPIWAAGLAKSRASEAAAVVCASSHQLHGAMGFTREYSLHRFSRRLWAWREEYGNEMVWNHRIGLTALSNAHDLWAWIVDRGATG
jgi:acyl-CoA dehydrogenase